MVFFLGDFRYFWTENIGNFAQIPSSWDASLNTGIGKSALSSLWINSYLNFTALFSNLGLSWDWISLIFWILPAIVLSFLSSFLLFNYLFRGKIKYSLLSGIIYTFNTYFLMILTGGQLGVGLSYSLVPLVFLTLIRTLKEPVLKNALVSGLVLGLQTIFDPRIVYITLIAVFFYLIFDFLKFKTIKDKIILLMPLIIAVLLNTFWILPLLITKGSPIPEGFNSVKGFEFFSFADFSHALSLLHPNWPENIFGKTYFMKPEFIILPILAYGSLFFIKNSKSEIRNPKQYQNSIPDSIGDKIQNNLTLEQFNNRIILFFVTLGLIGAFLAKGVNEPFGIVNLWIFEHVPGFAMFRDPTKFYLLVALSYSILIPFSVYSAYKRISAKCKVQSAKLQRKVAWQQRCFTQFKIQNHLPYICLPLVIGYWFFLISPTLLKAPFKIREIPNEYIQIKDFLHNQSQFFRTLWIPQWQRFGYFSNNHPAIGREEILKGDAKKQIAELKKQSSEKMLRELSVKYIIVPYDSEGEIFLKDRKYDNNQYLKTIEELKQIKWLKQVNCLIVKLLNCYGSDPFGKIAVFEVPNPKDHFWSHSENIKVQYSFIKPTEYKIEVTNALKGDLLIFSEGFDKNWIVENSEFRVQSSRFKNTLNSFVFPKDGNYSLEVYYEPQKWVNMGLGISGITLLGIFVVLRIGKGWK